MKKKGLAIESSGKLILMAIVILILSAVLFKYVPDSVKKILSFLDFWSISGKECPYISVDDPITVEEFGKYLEKAKDFALNDDYLDSVSDESKYYTRACVIDVELEENADSKFWNDKLDFWGWTGIEDSCTPGGPWTKSSIIFCNNRNSFMDKTNFKGENAIVLRGSEIDWFNKDILGATYLYIWKLKDFCGYSVGKAQITPNTIKYGMAGENYEICLQKRNGHFDYKLPFDYGEKSLDDLVDILQTCKFLGQERALQDKNYKDQKIPDENMRTLCLGGEFTYKPSPDITLDDIGKAFKEKDVGEFTVTIPFINYKLTIAALCNDDYAAYKNTNSWIGPVESFSSGTQSLLLFTLDSKSITDLSSKLKASENYKIKIYSANLNIVGKEYNPLISCNDVIMDIHQLTTEEAKEAEQTLEQKKVEEQKIVLLRDEARWKILTQAFVDCWTSAAGKKTFCYTIDAGDLKNTLEEGEVNTFVCARPDDYTLAKEIIGCGVLVVDNLNWRKDIEPDSEDVCIWFSPGIKNEILVDSCSKY